MGCRARADLRGAVAGAAGVPADPRSRAQAGLGLPGARALHLPLRATPLEWLDAGASPGGLDGLPRLRPDILKVGRDFVAGLESDPARRAVVEGLVQLVSALGGRVLAVGVEREPQLELLGRLGIPLGQGFVLGRPVPSMAATVTRGGALRSA